MTENMAVRGEGLAGLRELDSISDLLHEHAVGLRSTNALRACEIGVLASRLDRAQVKLEIALEAAAPAGTAPTWDDAYAAGVKLRDSMRERVAALATPSPQAPAEQSNAFSPTSARKQSSATASNGPSVGVYVASRASIPARSEMWRSLRSRGFAITSTWIDEAGEGETGDFRELWDRIWREIYLSSHLVLYAEPEDFPLKGALVEVGIALGMGKRVAVVAPSVKLEGRTCRPIGSWIKHPNVAFYESPEAALIVPAATQEQPAGSGASIADLQIALRIVGDWKEDSRGLVHVHKDAIRKAIVAALRSAGNCGSSRKVGEDGASERIWCMECGKSVSTPVAKDTIVRAWVQCPECIEKGKGLCNSQTPK